MSADEDIPTGDELCEQANEDARFARLVVKLGSDTAAVAAMGIVDLIRAAEWKGSGGRCPWCEEWPAVPGKDFPGGHAEDCPAREYFDAR